MDSQEESSEVRQSGTVDQRDFDSEPQTEFSSSPNHGPKTEDSVMDLHVIKPCPVLKRQLDCLTEEDEDVDYPPPRPITGLPEPINVDDNDIADKPISKNTEVSFSKAPSLQFTTEEIRNYIDHLQSKLDMLYLKIYEINRELIAVETEHIDDKHRIRNQQHILHQQEEELIFYRKFYQTGKNHANELISGENKQLKTPPKAEINKYSFGRRLNIETDPMDVDPDIKQVVDQRVQFVLEKQANEHISSPSPDQVQNILYINHSTDDNKGETSSEFQDSEQNPSLEAVIHDAPQDKDLSLLQYDPLGSVSSTSSCPSPIHELSNIHQDSEKFGKPEISEHEVPVQSQDKETLTDQKPEALSPKCESTYSEKNENLQLHEALDTKQDTGKLPTSPPISPSPKLHLLNHTHLPEETLYLRSEANFMENDNNKSLMKDQSQQETTSLNQMMTSIKDLSAEITRETQQQESDCHLDSESLSVQERQLIAELQKYVEADDMSDTTTDSSITGKVPCFPKCKTNKFPFHQKQQKSDNVKSKDLARKRTLTALSDDLRSRIKEPQTEIGNRRYPLKPIYRSNSQKTILPPIKPGTSIQQPKLPVPEKRTSLPNIRTKKTCLPDIHTTPIIKGFALPSVSTKSNIRNQMKNTILPNILKPETHSQKTVDAKRSLTKSASFRQPKVLLPVQPKLYKSNRVNESRPTKLPPICHLGLNNDVFPHRKD